LEDGMTIALTLLAIAFFAIGVGFWVASGLDGGLDWPDMDDR